MTRIIELWNDSTLNPTDIKAGMAAINKQLALHVAPEWLVSVELQLVDGADRTQKRQDQRVERIYLADHQEDAHFLGYHKLDKGVPRGFVFAKDSEAAGVAWTRALSHEAGEQAVDPWANLIWPGGKGPVGLAVEPWDPTQEDWYVINGVPVANFVLPSWFSGEGGWVDYMNLIRAPWILRPGGYLPYTRDFVTWNQQVGPLVSNVHAEVKALSRREQRGVQIGGNRFPLPLEIA